MASFIGNGTKQTICVVTAASDRQMSGRGMMLDKITLEQIVKEPGIQGGSVLLQGPKADLTGTKRAKTLHIYDRYRVRNECWRANNVLRRRADQNGIAGVPAPFPGFFCVAEASERRPGDAVMANSARMHSSPGVSDVDAESVIGEGSVVRVVDAGGKWTGIESDEAGIGWVSSDAVVPVSQFRRVPKWERPVRVEVGDGDYYAFYSFKSDGSFVVRETVQDPDESYRFVQRLGKLYAFKGIVWARVGNEAPYTSRMFLEKGKTLCWQGYLDGRCP